MYLFMMTLPKLTLMLVNVEGFIAQLKQPKEKKGRTTLEISVAAHA